MALCIFCKGSRVRGMVQLRQKRSPYQIVWRPCSHCAGSTIHRSVTVRVSEKAS